MKLHIKILLHVERKVALATVVYADTPEIHLPGGIYNGGFLESPMGSINTGENELEQFSVNEKGQLHSTIGPALIRKGHAGCWLDGQFVEFETWAKHVNMSPEDACMMNLTYKWLRV